MIVSNVGVISSPGATNTLFLDRAGTATPLSVVATFFIDSNSVLVVNQSRIQSGNLFIGNMGGGCVGMITNGGAVTSHFADLGLSTSSASNILLISGSGSVWSNQAGLAIGDLGSDNLLVVTNGGVADSGGQDAQIGSAFSSYRNVVSVSGTGSTWSGNAHLYIGFQGGTNQLIISGGGAVYDSYAHMADNAASGSNTVLVTGPGSIWSHGADLFVGVRGKANRLTIADSGLVMAGSAYIGYAYSNGANQITLNGGVLSLTGNLDVRNGSLALNSGTSTVNQLILTNCIKSVIAFSGGSFNSGGTSVADGLPFLVGNGSSKATFNLLGGVHSFANGMEILTNAFLTGCGTVSGAVVVDPGGTVLAGTLTFTGIVTNNGTMQAINGSVLESYGPLVNNGVIDIINGRTNFHSSFINNGTVLDALSVRVSKTVLSSNDVVIQIQSVVGHTYQLQWTMSLAPASWLNTGGPQAGTGSLLTFTDLGGAVSNLTRFYHVQVGAP